MFKSIIAMDKDEGIGTIYIDMRQRRLMIGDIHGQYRMLLDVLEKAGFRNGVDIKLPQITPMLA